MSPVSTLSTVSSVSSGSSNAGSSRASLRSASIVSSTTNESTNSPPESLSTRHEDQESNDGSPPSTDSGTGTLRKGIRRKFQEEIDCEELSRELAEQLAMSSELQNLLSKYSLLWRGIDKGSGTRLLKDEPYDLFV